MAQCLGPTMLLLLLLWLLLRWSSSAAQNRCVDAAEACTADRRCQRLRTEYVAQCLGPAPPGGCPRVRCRRALRRFFARGPPALTHALLFCPCGSPACGERRRQTFVPACAFSGPGPAPPSCLAPLDACEHSRVCRCGRELGKEGEGLAGMGVAQSPTALPPHRAGPASWPSRPSARLPPAPPTAASQTRPLTVCAPTRASWVRTVGIRRGRGSSRLPPPGWADYSVLWVPAGTAVTPNYLDNVSTRVAPWCHCRVSGNRQEECEAFRGLFTRNRCLDGAIQAFDSGWPPVLQDQLDSHQDLEHRLLQAGPGSVTTFLVFSWTQFSSWLSFFAA
ncbi:GDNF family receptor alpha-4 isoform X2 [Rhinolophus sinicus]|uniref:GDNF family receptor alpha-4 isoform X2 n=1 Tax=Rhinolophus sinicus TaxID=89399 RepID=UPI003D7C1345